MSELTEFLNKLNACSLVVLTTPTEERVYCRFFLDGVYTDRMFVSDLTILGTLSQLQGEGEEIDFQGIAKLKAIFLAV